MNPPSEDIKDMLAGESSLALTFATNLFVGEIPSDAMDECVGVYDSGGENPDAHIIYEKPFVQIRVRGNKGDYLGAHALAQNCKNTLNGRNNETVNGTRYICIWVVGDIMTLGFDDNKRPLFTVNFRIHRTVG